MAYMDSEQGDVSDDAPPPVTRDLGFCVSDDAPPWDLGFCGLLWRTSPFSCLVLQARATHSEDLGLLSMMNVYELQSVVDL